jgi:hypothetical protein
MTRTSLEVSKRLRADIEFTEYTEFVWAMPADQNLAKMEGQEAICIPCETIKSMKGDVILTHNHGSDYDLVQDIIAAPNAHELREFFQLPFAIDGIVFNQVLSKFDGENYQVYGVNESGQPSAKFSNINEAEAMAGLLIYVKTAGTMTEAIQEAMND